MWTLTTDPSVISPQEALETANKRFHRLTRELHRTYGAIPYFKALEFTESGLPHIHFITPQWMDVRIVRAAATRLGFGRILNVTKLSRKNGLRYVAKYATKCMADVAKQVPRRMRLWSTSRRLIPTWQQIKPAAKYALVYLTKNAANISFWYCVEENGALYYPRSPIPVALSSP